MPGLVDGMSEWIDGNLKPVREGVYLRDFGKVGQFYSWWSKVGGWQAPCSTPQSAGTRVHTRRSKLQELPWRGQCAT